MVKSCDKKDDIYPTNNLTPEFWGPFGWGFNQSVAFGYPINPTQVEKQIYKQYFESLKFILPCSKCREHYSQHIEEHPIDRFLDSRKSLTKWIYVLHCKVNKALGKKIKDPTYEEFCQEYEKHRLYDIQK